MNSENADINSTKSDGIEMNKFLDFLKITCQLNQSITNNGDRSCGDNIDYDKLANNEIINRLFSQSSKEKESKDGCGNAENKTAPVDKTRRKSTTKLKTDFVHDKPNIHPELNEKLDEVIIEGILDPILPFICQSTCLTTTNNCGNSQMRINKVKIGDLSPNNNHKLLPSSNCDSEKKASAYEKVSTAKTPRYDEGRSRPKDSTKNPRRKSVGNSQANAEDKKAESEVVIHVCDEIKNISKDFTCPQHLLVSKMGYFADVTAGQKLEDMDISVHCDIQIFEWLMKWVKRDPNQSENWPQLDATNVVPILVSASFLQMEPLLLDCLTFCHSRLNEVVKSSTNLSCLNDSIITRLSAMFTNLELEMVKDKKERVTPRLWIKIIQSLCEPEPQALRGHYFSLAGLFRCNKCGKYLTQSASSYVNCIPSNVRLNRWGQLISKHSRDTSWQITNYVGVLFKELKSWRKVYWKLWGHCHYLYCCICEMHFPVYQMNWCQYHSENPQFLGPVSEGKIAGPAGRYPCCGQQAFRYESLPGPNGCQYREHSVLVESDRDKAILTLAQIAAEGNCLYDSAPSKLPANNNYEPRWAGISLMPTKCRQGLLPPLMTEDHHTRVSHRVRQAAASLMDSSSETDTSEKLSNWQLSTSSDGCESECSSPRQFGRKKHIIRQTKMIGGGRYWSGEMSARSNQDNQRDFEEKIMKQVIAMVNKKTGNDTSISYQHYQPGGTYVRLEGEWKDKIKNLNKQKMK